jgi:hypothetical protein
MLGFRAKQVAGSIRVASNYRCKFARFRFPLVSLCGCDLLFDGVWVGLLVLDSVEVLAVDFGERRAVARVAEEQVEYCPDEREAAGLAGEAAHHFGSPADLTERPFEEIRASPPFAVSERVAQVHDERVEVV